MDEFMGDQGWLTVGNRTSKTLTVTFNGRQWVLPPYPAKRSLPKIVADRAVMQHPVMGTEDPLRPQVFESLVYVEGWKPGGQPMPTTPIEQSSAVERLDRTQTDPDFQRGEFFKERQFVERVDAGRDALFEADGAGE